MHLDCRHEESARTRIILSLGIHILRGRSGREEVGKRLDQSCGPIFSVVANHPIDDLDDPGGPDGAMSIGRIRPRVTAAVHMTGKRREHDG